MIRAASPAAFGVALLGVLWLVSRRAEDGDEAAFLVGVLLLLAFSPIVWHHYLLLLFVPLAVYRPRFGAIWLLPLVCWVVWQGAFFYTGPAERVVFLAVIAGLTAWMLTRRRETACDDLPPAGTLPAWR